MHPRPAAFVVFLLLVAAGCGQPVPDPQATPEGASTAAEPAAPAADMCAEHGVLEALCTKCNPGLAPVFQAKGDWCAEHGFPESICPICNPERGGRPAIDLTAGAEPAGAAPADGTKVRFKTREIARLAGLEVVRVTEQEAGTQVVATARLSYDSTRVAAISPGAPGVVRGVLTDVGTRVRRNAPLAIVESAGVGADRSRLKAAVSRADLAEAAYKRLSGLEEEGITAGREVQAARQEVDAALAEVAAARSALSAVGATDEGAARYTLTAPIAGVVTVRNVTVGRVVSIEDLLFEIVDTSVMWAEIDLPEAELSRVAVGQAATIRLEGAGERDFTGRLGYIAPAIDPHTRTALGRVELPNPDGLLRANMFGTATIAVDAARRNVTVPRQAVQQARGASLVFVRLAEDLYEARRVQVLAEGELVTVSGRLAPGEEVVTDGSFLLKTETLKESIGAGCCDVD